MTFLEILIEFENAIYEIDIVSLEPFYSVDGNGEKIWFSEKMNWVIYVSHKGSITFGDKSFIKKIKKSGRNGCLICTNIKQ